MSALVKWIGGSTVVIAVLIGTMMFAGHRLDAEDREMAGWVQEGDAAGEPATPGEEPLVIDYAPDGAATPAEPRTGQQAEAMPAASNEPFVIKRILPIEGAIKYGEWHWDDAGVPDGPLVVTVDLQARVISVFRNGYEIGAAAALIGSPAHPTPTGTFPILSKERRNVSEKYNNAPMPWTLRLTHDGVAIHGGSTVERGYASHGCIGVPDDFVSKLYSIAKVGDRVIITDGVTANVGTALIG